MKVIIIIVAFVLLTGTHAVAAPAPVAGKRTGHIVQSESATEAAELMAFCLSPYHAQTTTTATPLSSLQLTPDGESHELPYSCYDYPRDIVWLSWKQRHIVEGVGLRDDAHIVYTLRKGEVVGAAERVSDVLASGENVKFPDFQVAPDGHVFFAYETSIDTHMKLMERLSTPAALALAPTLTAATAGQLDWTFPTEFAVNYQAQTSTDLHTWTPLGEPFIGDGEDVTIGQAISEHSSGFLRLTAVRP